MCRIFSILLHFPLLHSGALREVRLWVKGKLYGLLLHDIFLQTVAGRLTACFKEVGPSEYKHIASGQQFMGGLVLAFRCSLGMASLFSNINSFSWDSETLGTPDIHAMPASWLRTPKEDSCQKWFGVWCQNAWRYSSLILANWLLLPHESAEQICFNFCVHLSFGESCCFVFCFFLLF